jgi:peptidoglycan/LPS O-acetylase OafA/YrhL
LTHLGAPVDGHFAVMVFFVISGYCITASAESCRRQGFGFRNFMWRRFKRIYPPYWFAIAFFTLTRAIKTVRGGPNDLHRSLLEWIQNLTLTQWLSSLFHPLIWPDQSPRSFVAAFWSLNYEEQFYLVTAIGLALAAYRAAPSIVPVLVLAAIGTVWNFTFPGNFVCGFFIEYWVHFALGACLYFVLCVYPDPRARLVFVTGVVLLGILSAGRLVPWTPTTVHDLRAMVELAFLAAVTLGLFFLRPLSTRISASAVWRPIAALGTISYSLYLIHQFNLHLVGSIAESLLPAGAPSGILMSAKIGLHLAIATAFWYCCERPFLNRNITRCATASMARDAVRNAG